MSSETQTQNDSPTDVVGTLKPAPETRKRPRLDLSTAPDGTRERKRGKSMFGLVLGTLNKAKIEDKERNASEAAKKRQLIDQRLQTKLRKETDSVRRAEEAKKNKTTANRKEEELQLKDSIYKLRRTQHRILANFLLTSDIISSEESSPSSNPLAPPSRSHPPPLYYLPAILTPAQEAFLSRRKAEVNEAVEKEWELFKEERATGIAEINQFRKHSADEEARMKTEKEEVQGQDEMDTDVPPSTTVEEKSSIPPSATKDTGMDVDETPAEKEKEANPPPKKEETVAMQGDDDDAVDRKSVV